MNKWLIPAVAAVALLSGCSSVQRGSIPVVDSGTAVSNSERISANGGFRQTTVKRPAQGQSQTQAIPQGDSGVVVMVPGAATTSTPISTTPITPGPITPGPITPGPIDTSPVQSAPINQGSYSMPSSPSGIPSASSGGLSADEQLDGPVLALLTTAQQQQASGDLNGASSSLCLLYTSPSPRDGLLSRMPSSA